MSLQSIVSELDRELGRLHALRSIVAGLSRTPKAVARLLSTPVNSSVHDEVSEPIASLDEQLDRPRGTRVNAGKPRGRRTKEIVLEPRAFAAAIPTGPVVFNPTQLAEERAKRDQGKALLAAPEPVQTAEDLDALTRSLAARWSTSSNQSLS